MSEKPRRGDRYDNSLGPPTLPEHQYGERQRPASWSTRTFEVGDTLAVVRDAYDEIHDDGPMIRARRGTQLEILYDHAI